jgi:hypothetical protein
MLLKKLKPRESLNKAYLKVKPIRNDIENFKTQLIRLLNIIDEKESEEFHKNILSDFLKETYYSPNYFINTKGRTDLVIHNGKKSDSSVGIIIEVKKPSNKAEMIRKNNFNVKAFHEILLYYLRERINEKNLEIKHLIITNVYEWFIIDVNIIEKAFVQNKKLIELFKNFELGSLSGKTTDFFFKEIAAPIIDSISNEIVYSYFDFEEYRSLLKNANGQDENPLIALFKLLSPEHLLKLPFINDSNSLDKGFYSELLHIIGLNERESKGKKIIERKDKNSRCAGSLIENAINQIDSLGKIKSIENPSHFGKNYEERIFNIALELTITWINRILFLKLLEAQLISYHKDDKSYSFLNIKKVSNFDDLNNLFFQVLAKKSSERNEEVMKTFSKVPYLNSSLFEPSKIESKTIFISNLVSKKSLPIFSTTVLKNNSGNKQKGDINTLDYLLLFLDAYDFTSESSENIQEENKSLINASVLGIIFEKINGYKEGSFFTPGFVTMYMCRETIRKAIIQKFNEIKNWSCKNLTDLYNQIENRDEANSIINDLKICDPAVGSGHFLVSALNEIISIKNDLRLLQDRKGRRLKEYHFEVINDELMVTDEDGEFFRYNIANKESQRVQEAIFHEKQNIIEKCLFGVDINPNSVQICRLRLWIELLKHAYYKDDGNLETLPNIDINIKCGNSLICRYEIDSNLKKELRKNKISINVYRDAVQKYREARNKDEKWNLEELILELKTNFRSVIGANDPKLKRLRKLQGELENLVKQKPLFVPTKKDKTLKEKRKNKLQNNIKKLKDQLDEIKNNKIYEEAFEWRLEFPEMLNSDGDFIGFDLVIGNPPYLGEKGNKEKFRGLKTTEFGKKFYQRRMDYFYFFIAKAIELAKNNGIISLITTNYWTTASGAQKLLRPFIKKETNIQTFIDFGEYKLFESAQGQHNCVFILKKERFNKKSRAKIIKIEETEEAKKQNLSEILNYSQKMKGINKFRSQSQEMLYDENTFNITFLDSKVYKLINKIRLNNCQDLNNFCTISGGVSSSADKVTKSNLKHCDENFIKHNDISIGQGVLLLSDIELKSLNLTKNEQNYIKPYYKSKEIMRYVTNEKPEKFLIYATHVNGSEIMKQQRIFNHLKRYRCILENRSQDIELEKAIVKGHWFVLTNGRPKIDFQNKKIVCPYRSKTNTFGFNNINWFAGRDVYFILNFSLNPFYLLGILNSSLVYFWLRHKGKRKGKILEMYPEPLRNIPIKIVDNNIQKKLIVYVKTAISASKKLITLDDKNLVETLLKSEVAIDANVAKIYNLTKNEYSFILKESDREISFQNKAIKFFKNLLLS